MEDTNRRGHFEFIPLIITDGFLCYRVAIWRVFKNA
jgi:hypothetical protein